MARGEVTPTTHMQRHIHHNDRALDQLVQFFFEVHVSCHTAVLAFQASASPLVWPLYFRRKRVVRPTCFKPYQLDTFWIFISCLRKTCQPFWLSIQGRLAGLKACCGRCGHGGCPGTVPVSIKIVLVIVQTGSFFLQVEYIWLVSCGHSRYRATMLSLVIFLKGDASQRAGKDLLKLDMM